jgi:hypothetical protein
MLQAKGHNEKDWNAAMKKAEEFDYEKITKIPLGIFYQEGKDVYEEQL